MNIRDDKLALKALLMKNVKTNNTGKAVITKDDEWREECEWDELDEISKDKKTLENLKEK